MRVTMVSTLCLASLLVFPGLAATQEAPQKKPDPNAPQKKPAPKHPDLSATQMGLHGLLKAQVPATLEEFLAKALKENADIRLAESKVHEAEAQLTKTRLDVMQKVVKLHADMAAYKAAVKLGEDLLKNRIKLYEQGALPLSAYEAAEKKLQQAKSDLAKAEAEVPFLIGNQPAALAFSPDGKQLLFTPGPTAGQIIVWDTVTGKQLSREFFPPATALVQRAPHSDKLRAILDAPVQGDVDRDKLLKLFREKAKGINLHTDAFERLHAANKDLLAQSLRLSEPVPLGAALQWFEDTTGFRFVVRAYGIVLSSRVPPGATLLLDAWKDPAVKTTLQKPK